MTDLDNIEKYLDRIDNEEVIKEDAAHLQWTRQNYAKNLLVRSAMLVKFMALPTAPLLIRKKQIEILRGRIDSIERMMEEDEWDT